MTGIDEIPIGDEGDRNSRAAALAAAVGLSALFLVVYSGTNWITSLRSDVGTWYYEWERWIPFVPWMVIPYMSIDLFFFVCPFLCRRKTELKLLSSRIILAIVAAGGCFLLFPLQLVADAPPTDGVCGWIFDWFRSLDKPYNLCPSLHIALRTILADTYARNLSGLLRLGSQVWFSLIGFSTLLTYQHHVVDVAGGFILAGLCFYLYSHSRWRQPVTPNYRVGVGYLILLVGVGLLSAALWPLGAMGLWPAAGLALVVAAYWGTGPGIYRKHDGRIPLASRLLLGPILFGQYLSLLYYRRQCRPWDAVVPGVWIGRQLNERDARDAREHGVTAVLDLTAEFSEAADFRSVIYENLPILDLTAPTPGQLREAVAFISRHSSSGTVLVHCKVGYSRSAAVVGAYLLAGKHCSSTDEALARLRAVRPSIVIRPEAEMALRNFEADLNSCKSKQTLPDPRHMPTR
jgi:protein-tyrosine phosphatase/membrane-associated phospholipid phosphatase